MQPPKSKPPLGECVMTASHTRRACDNGGACFCTEHPEEVARINGRAPSAARTLDPEKTQLQETGRLKVFQLDFAQLTEIVDSLGCDPRYVAVTGELRWLLELASPTPGCECDTCRAIRAHQHKLARAGSKSKGLTS